MSHCLESQPAALSRSTALHQGVHDLHAQLMQLQSELMALRQGVQRFNEELQTTRARVSHLVTSVRWSGGSHTTTCERSVCMRDLISSGRLYPVLPPVARECIPAQTLVERSLQIAKSWITLAGHRLTTDWPPAPIPVQVETERMARALAELIINAALYTPARGQIDVSVRRASARVEIRVADNGTGIPREMLPLLMAELSHDAVEPIGGRFGLGLKVLHAALQGHCGTLDAYSDGVGRGSVFTVTLPAASISTAGMDDRRDFGAPTHQLRRRIIIATGSEEMHLTLLHRLRDIGHEACLTQLPQLLEIVQKRRPDIVLVDEMALHAQGIQLIQQIRSVVSDPEPVIMPMGRSELDYSLQRERVRDLSRYRLRGVREKCVRYLEQQLALGWEMVRRLSKQTQGDLDGRRVIQNVQRVCETTNLLTPVLACEADKLKPLSRAARQLGTQIRKTWHVMHSRT